MEVDEGNGAMKEKTDSDYIWTFERANQLITDYTTAAQEDKRPLFVEADLFRRVKSKVNAIAAMKISVKQALKEKHDIKTLRECLKLMEEMETVDFVLEQQKLREKIKLIVDMENAIENNSKLKQSIEMLDSIN